jgi:hypothetical protein
MASPTITTGLTAFIPSYWDTLFGENLYPNLYLYAFGSKRALPRNFGTSVKVPRLKKQNIVAAVASEGVAIGTCPLSAQFVSGVLKQFAGAYKHSDVVVMTALSDVIELSLRDIARDIARRMDTHIRDQISGAGVFVGGGRAASGSVATASILKGSDILRAAVLLDSFDNPRPPDGLYPVLTHPLAVYDLQASLTGNSWLEVNKYGDAQTVGNIYRGEMGRFFGARVITSSNAKRLVAIGGMSAQASGYRSFMFAPDAFYVTEISDMTAKTFVKQLGSAGAADPVNQFATVGAKVFFTAFSSVPSGGPENRIARIVHGSSVS